MNKNLENVILICCIIISVFFGYKIGILLTQPKGEFYEILEFGNITLKNVTVYTLHQDYTLVKNFTNLSLDEISTYIYNLPYCREKQYDLKKILEGNCGNCLSKAILLCSILKTKNITCIILSSEEYAIPLFKLSSTNKTNKTAWFTTRTTKETANLTAEEFLNDVHWIFKFD